MRTRVLLDELRSELAPVEAAIRGHRYLGSFAAALPRSLERFTGEQYAILTSDRRSFAQLAARFPAGGPGDLFLALAEGEGQGSSGCSCSQKSSGSTSIVSAGTSPCPPLKPTPPTSPGSR